MAQLFVGLSFTRILFALLVTTIIYVIVDFIRYKYQNRIMMKINKNILQSTSMYFNDMDIDIKEIPNFRNFVFMRLKDNKFDEYVENVEVEYIDAKKIKVSYLFLRDENNYQIVSFDIKKKDIN